ADLYRAETEKVLERSRLDLVAETERAYRSMEGELARMREETVAEVKRQRETILGDPAAAIGRAQDEVKVALDRLAAAASSLSRTTERASQGDRVASVPHDDETGPVARDRRAGAPEPRPQSQPQ